MDKKVLWEKLKRPTGWLLAVIYTITLLCIVGALVILFVDYQGTALELVAYALFGLAACTLAYSVYTIVLYAPMIKGKLKGWLHSIPFIHKLLENYGFRTVLFSAVSLVISVGYSVYNGVIALMLPSLWYGALAAYYILLVAMRGGITLYHGKNRGKEGDELVELKKYRTSGILLVVTILALSIAILQMVAANEGFVHMGLMIYVAATYTFYKITMSIVNLVRANKQTGYTIRALRDINLADAAVSVLALQTAMFHSFGDEGLNTGLANALTGAAVCLVVLTLGVMMIVSANKKLKQVKNTKEIQG
ncbi:MAG: hypothetical protein IJ514_02300 [Clostridia bacterium]|nr:hypothetical protein [Clostridia bacterium]